MGCDFPEHHGGGGIGSWVGNLALVIGGALVVAIVVQWFLVTVLPLLIIVATTIGGVVMAAGAVFAWWKVRQFRARGGFRALAARSAPEQVSAQAQPAIGRGDVHLHFHGQSSDEIAAIVARQQEPHPRTIPGSLATPRTIRPGRGA